MLFRLQRTLYTLTIRLLRLGIGVAAVFQPKARQWVAGRNDWAGRMRDHLAALPQAPRIWMHCASLGEFEQGRPLLEKLKADDPDLQIVLTFFSPSGYEVRRDYPLADYVGYLPLDLPSNAREFLGIVRPDLVVFVKYDFWFHFLEQVQKERIPLLLIAALLRGDQFFLRSYAGWFKAILAGFDRIFTQDADTLRLLEKRGITRADQAGDPRVDRVRSLAAHPHALPLIERFAGDHPVLVAGSTWPADEKLLLPLLPLLRERHWKVIIAPHDVSEGHIRQLTGALSLPHLRYSGAGEAEVDTVSILVIDNVGLLAHIYQYGDLAYIGGGFGAGIHNTLEPIAFGLPVLFGPKYGKFAEAWYLLENGGGFAVSTPDQLQSALLRLLDDIARKTAGSAARQYIEARQGATGKIAAYIQNRRWLSRRSG